MPSMPEIQSALSLLPQLILEKKSYKQPCQRVNAAANKSSISERIQNLWILSITNSFKSVPIFGIIVLLYCDSFSAYSSRWNFPRLLDSHNKFDVCGLSPYRVTTAALLTEVTETVMQWWPNLKCY